MSCVRGCCARQADHYKSVTLSGPSPKRDAARREERDMHAYKRLVQSGVQPKQIDGAAELERGASTSFEVEHARILVDPVDRRKTVKAFEDAKRVKVDPLPPAA